MKMKRIISIVFVFVGGSVGLTTLPYFWDILKLSSSPFNNVFVNLGIGALIFFLLSLVLANGIIRAFKKIENYFSKQSATFLLFGALGIIIGLVLAWLIGIPLVAWNINIISDVVPTLLSFGLAYLGFYVGTTRIEEFRKLFTPKKIGRASCRERV